MAMTARKHQDEVQRAKKVLEEHGDVIKQRYAVKQMGIGYKKDKGKFTDQIAIVFYVDKKMEKDELESRGIQEIPQKIEGVPTEIVEIAGGFRPRVNPKK